MPLDKNISREDFDKRLEAATARRNQNAEAIENRNAQTTQYVAEIETTLDRAELPAAPIADPAALREKLRRLSRATAQYADAL